MSSKYALTIAALISLLIMAPVNAAPPQTLERLACSGDEIAKFNDATGQWGCASDETGTDTLSNLSCSQDQIAKFDGTE